MADDAKKITFGFGTLEQALKKCGLTNDGTLAFGYDEDHGGAIVAQGKLVTPKLLDFKYTNTEDTLTLELFYIKNVNDSTPEVATETINLKTIISEEVQAAVQVDELAKDVIEKIQDSIQDPEDEIGQALIEVLQEAILEEVTSQITALEEQVSALEEFAKSDFVKAAEDSCITVTSEEAEETDFKTFEIGINVDGETITIQDGKLTANIENIIKDKFVKEGSYDKDTQEIVLIIENAEEEQNEIRIDVKDLVKQYTEGEGITISDENEISISEEYKSKINELHTAIFGNPATEDTDDAVPVITVIKTILENLATLQSTIDDANLDQLKDDVDELKGIIGDSDTEGLAKDVEDLKEAVEELQQQQQDNSIYWTDLED